MLEGTLGSRYFMVSGNDECMCSSFIARSSRFPKLWLRSAALNLAEKNATGCNFCYSLDHCERTAESEAYAVP